MRCCLPLIAISCALGATYLYTRAQSSPDGTPIPADGGRVAANDLAAYINSVRQGNYNDSELYPLTQRYGTPLLPPLRRYARDENPAVAFEASRSMFFLLKSADNLPDRQKIVDCLIEMLNEDYHTDLRCDAVRPMLVLSRASDFTPGAKQILQSWVASICDGTYKNPYQIQEIILLVGIANVQSQLARLGELVGRWDDRLRQMHQREIGEWHKQMVAYGENPPRGLQASGELLRKKTYWQSSSLWDVLRARARMGMKEDIRRCIEMAESHPDPNYRAAYLFDQLAYIRQPEVVEYLRSYLDDNRVPVRRSKDVVVASYAARAASALAGMFENPPIKSYQTRPENILTLQKWMAEQKTWRIVR
jgi:hypothetical protein